MSTERDKSSEFTLLILKDQLEAFKHPETRQRLAGLMSDDGSLDEALQDAALLIAVINSMTPSERETPSIIDSGRRQRIAHGSGTTAQAVTDLTRQFSLMKPLMEPNAKLPPAWVERRK